MSDDEFGSFDFGDGEPEATIHEDDEAENRDNRREMSRISMAMTQKLYGNQAGTSNRMDFDTNKYVEPRNRFEEILESENVRIAVDEENDEKFLVLGDGLNHEELTRNFEKRIDKSRDFFEEFQLACNNDQQALALYLSPMKSKLGLQDTVFRAFLQIRAAQTKTFDLLLQKLNILAKRSDESDLLLAQTCVAHLRHLNRIFEPLAVFNTIFDFPFRLWSPNVRNSLIAALPEIFTDISLQQATALRLNQEILETQNIPDLPSFQFSIMETLRLLRMESSVGREIRKNLIHLAMELDVACLPSLVAFSLGSLLIQGAKSGEEEELLFHEMLRETSRALKIETIKKKTSKADSLIYEIYAHFFKFFQLDRKGWKHITSWINKRKSGKFLKEEKDSEENPENEEQEKEKEEEEEPVGAVMNTFETMLILSLLSAPEACPTSFVTAVNARILTMPANVSTKFLKLIDLVISFKKFSSTHLDALIHVARNCVWSTDAVVRQIGISVWKRLLVGMEKKDRKKVFDELMRHFTQSELECEAVLDVLFKVIKSHVNVISEYSAHIQKCIEHIHNLSISNIKRLFQVILLMSGGSGQNFDIDEIINRFLMAVNEREKFLGVLAILMKIQVEMSRKHTENQEIRVREGIERIEEAVRASPNLRGAFYDHMRMVIENHKRTEEIRCILEWSDDLMQRFKEDFFEENSEEPMEASSRLILKPHVGRLVEVTPMFNLIKELLVMKMRWREDEDDDSLRSSYDACVIRDLNFAFEAIVSLDSSEDKTEKLNHLFFLIQWSRTVLNAFLAKGSIDYLSSEDVSKLATKLFYLMMDSEKKIASLLPAVSNWTIPNLKFEKKRDIITVLAEKRASGKGRPKKRRSDETMVEDDTMPGPEDVEEALDFPKDAPSAVIQLKNHLVTLKLRPIVHLMKLTKTKRSCLIYLCDELQTVLDVLVKMKKKSSPMLAARASASPGEKLDKLYHGDAVTVWYCVKKAVEEVWGIVDNSFDFFATLANASQETNAKMQKDLEDLGLKSLQLMHTILGGELCRGDEKMSASERGERKQVLIRIVERAMSGAEHLTSDVERARLEIAAYLVKSAEFAPTPAVGVAILDVFEDLKLDEEEDAEVRKAMAKYALAYLKKDWSKVDEVWSKGTRFTSAVRDILSHYIRLRKEKDQLLAIKWILTNKVVQLVPEDDKRKSNVFSQQSDDDLLEKEDQKATFHCINKATFGVIFKTLFSSLNTCCSRRDMSATAAKNELIDAEETLASWDLASSCFLILCLLLRVNKIRTNAVLTTAIREGKQFLVTVSKKSSFIFLLDNITKGSNFDAICERVEKILSSVQQGNRVLQSIGNFAKTNKCVHLLKKFPELRAESENCLRVIHSAMVKNECLNAFTVGLVKSRSIDGEIITEQRESSVDTDEED